MLQLKALSFQLYLYLRGVLNRMLFDISITIKFLIALIN